MKKKYCVLWSGGKDCFLAYSLVIQPPDDLLFVTFVPPKDVFKCHPLSLLVTQSNTLGIDHEFLVIDGCDWQDAYRKAFIYLKIKYEFEKVVTGDILWDMLDIEDYWLYKLLQDLHLDLVLPLRGMYAEEMIELLQRRGIEAVITGVREDCYIRSLVGQPVSLSLLNAHGFSGRNHLDICGERGEYHTTVCAYQDIRFRSSDLTQLDHKATYSMKHVAFTEEELALSQPRIKPG